VQFRYPPPGNLTQEGSTYYADWLVAGDNFGYTKAEVEDWVSQALNDPRGIEATGIVSRQVTSSPHVIFRVVETIADHAGAIGVAYWNSFPVLVEVEAAYFGNMDLITHEALHAFLYGIHSPEGTDSVLEPIEDPGEEWLSVTDIAQIEAWLAGPGAPLPIEPVSYWFPGDLPHYITKWIVPEGAKGRIVAVVLAPSSVMLRAVCNESHEALLDGDFQQFGAGVDASFSGFLTSEWAEVPSGELYVGVKAEGETLEGFEDFVAGFVDVQIAASTATGGGTPIPG
jgi:hypothetical protein